MHMKTNNHDDIMSHVKEISIYSVINYITISTTYYTHYEKISWTQNGLVLQY